MVIYRIELEGGHPHAVGDAIRDFLFIRHLPTTLTYSGDNVLEYKDHLDDPVIVELGQIGGVKKIAAIDL